MDKFPTFVRKGTYTYKTAGMSGAYAPSRGKGAKAVIEVTDWNYVIRELGKINDEVRKELKKDFRKAAKKVQQGIQNEIRSKGIGRGTMSGFAKKVIPGRVTWGTGKPATSAVISLPRTNAKKGKYQIVKIRVASPATIIADMAGKSNSATNSKAYTAVYKYSLTPNGSKLHSTPPGTRMHKITHTGSRKFILNLNSALGSRASRMVYPGAEKAQPEATEDIAQIIGQALATINKRLRG